MFNDYNNMVLTYIFESFAYRNNVNTNINKTISLRFRLGIIIDDPLQVVLSHLSLGLNILRTV